MLSPTCLAKLLCLSVFACILEWFAEWRARLSAESGASSGIQGPLDASGFVCCGVDCNPVYGNREEYRRNYAALSHSQLYGKPLSEGTANNDTALMCS